ncbi:hypothetical protein OG785_33350 [Streptomyces sp. NBC_00006]|uniref:hypothetical protein n=1 Tax=Streptomyces sp. NBC_00006 TaxID=2975619 RepID=UPI00225566B4|nr:hypothetical protein [Streptomyces sp. NBC_00006]MCX5535426.1 hypothetical protein [Streptomyces sp. NBC_00006]
MSEIYTDDVGDDDTGYQPPKIPDVVTQEWINDASPVEMMLAASQGKLRGSGAYAVPVDPNEKPQKPFRPFGPVEGAGPQISRDDLKRMSTEDINRAYREGLLDDLLY